MKIGTLAGRGGVSPVTIRYYESLGLVGRPERTRSNYRVYRDDDLRRLQFIVKAKRLGLSLEDIKGILQLHDRQEPTCVHVRALIDRKLSQLDTLLKELAEFRGELSSLRQQAGDMEDCRPSGGHICGIVERGEVSMGPQALAWVEVRR